MNLSEEEARARVFENLEEYKRVKETLAPPAEEVIEVQE